MDDFEKMLVNLSKPEVKELSHQHVLADQIIQAKNKHALSFWWLLIPIYVIAMLAMKTFYVKTSLKEEINSFRTFHPLLAFSFFILGPIIFILFNSFLVRRTLSGVVLTVLFFLILLMYILTCYV